LAIVARARVAVDVAAAGEVRHDWRDRRVVHELDEAVVRLAQAAQVEEPAVGTGLALRDPAPKLRSAKKPYTGNHRKYRCLARNWPRAP
jgi:hypothetical protein